MNLLRSALLPLLLLSASARAATWRVPADWPTLQEALLASQDGDTVLAAPGQHAGPLDFLGRQVRVASEAGAALTAILPDGLGPIVSFVSGEGPGAQLEGFTLEGGAAPLEGGLCGGAIRVEDASPVLRGNVIRGNSAVLGGGLCLLRSAALLLDNQILDNSAEEGAGVYVLGGAPQLAGNQFAGNEAEGVGFGGGLALEASAALVQGNRFTGNRARLGGAVSCRRSGEGEAAFSGNSLAGNAADFGGGLYLLDCAPLLQSCILAHSSQGAALWCNGAQPQLGCCDLFGNAGGDEPCGTDLGGNISADPRFCDPDAGDLRLQPGSPCWSTACGTIGAWMVDCDGADVDEPRDREGPARLALGPACPNPFNPVTTLRVTLRRSGPARLVIHDLAGRTVAVLLDGPQPAGERQLRFTAEGLPSGVYFAVLQAGDVAVTRKLLLLK